MRPPLPIHHLRKIIGWAGFMILFYLIFRAYLYKGFEKEMYVTEVAVALTVMAIGVLYWTYKPQIERFTERIRTDELQKEHTKEIVNALKIMSDGYYGDYLDEVEFLIPYPYSEYKQYQRKNKFPTHDEKMELFNKRDWSDKEEEKHEFVPFSESSEGEFEQVNEHLKSYKQIKILFENAKKTYEEWHKFFKENEEGVYEINQKCFKLDNPESHPLYPQYCELLKNSSDSQRDLQKSLKILVQQLEHGKMINGICELGY